MAAMPEPSRWFVIVNPVSGGGRARRRWPRLAAALERRGIAHESAMTTSAGHAAELARQAVSCGYRRLMAVGGDGSFNELVNGLFAKRDVSLDELLVSVAPLGTGNDWAQAMQVPDDPDELAAAMARGLRRNVDLGIAEAADTPGGGTRRLAFHNVAGAGLDAEVLRHAPRAGPRALAYLVGLARALVRYRAPRFELTADGQSWSGRYWIALAAIGPYCGGGMRLAPGALPDDGYLDLVTIEPLPIVAAISRVPRLFSGRLARDPAVRVLRCRSLTIRSDAPCGVEIDGQPFGTTPVRIGLLPGALSVLDCRRSTK